MRNFLTLCLVIALSACTSVPITQRSRVNFVPDSQVLPASFQQYKGFLEENKSKISKDKSKTEELKAVGSKISKAVDKFMRANDMAKEADSYKWEFNLIEDKTVNAWCMPGGKVVFYTGILPIADNINGVAAIMGHEVAHAFAKHGQERMSSLLIQQGVGIGVAYGTRNSENSKLWNTVYGVGSQVGMLKFSRTHENEADKLGMVFMIMAGYQPKEAINVWVRMSQLNKGKQPPQFLSTHPSNETRVRNLKAFLPEAQKLAAKYNAN